MGDVKRLEPTNYIVIQGWMVEELGLSGNELWTFGLIWGFSQTDEQWFTGGHEYIMRWLGCTKQTVINVTRSLENKGFIECQKVGKCNKYRSKNLTQIGQNILPDEKEQVKNFEEQVKKTDLNRSKNLTQEINKNININNKPPIIPLTGDYTPQGGQPDNAGDAVADDKPKRSTAFHPPTVEEVRAYCHERGNGLDPERFVDYYTSNGWMVGKAKMKDWRAAVRMWERSEDSRSSRRIYEEKPVGTMESSFDTDEFFEAALRRSYEIHGIPGQKGEKKENEK